MNNIEVVALGELLIDFTYNGVSSQGNPVFEANPGGAPCNVLSMLSKLGHKTAFIEKVGDDAFGREDTIETTGAGDTFGACSLHYVLKHGLNNLSEQNLTELLRFANAAASIVTTRKGALRVMPTEDEVLQQLKM